MAHDEKLGKAPHSDDIIIIENSFTLSELVVEAQVALLQVVVTPLYIGRAIAIESLDLLLNLCGPTLGFEDIVLLHIKRPLQELHLKLSECLVLPLCQPASCDLLMRKII